MTRGRQIEVNGDRLNRLYNQSGMSIRQVSNVIGCSETAVRNAMERHQIEPRRTGNCGQRHVTLKARDDGYEVWRDNISSAQVSVHQLTLIANGANPHLVFQDDYVVHHKNGYKYDNRPSNLKLMTRREHAKHHADKDDLGQPQQYSNEDMLSWLDTFVSEFGFVPAPADIKGWPGPSPELYRMRFDSWKNAIQEAGYEPRGGA